MNVVEIFLFLFFPFFFVMILKALLDAVLLFFKEFLKNKLDE
jgi:hypothetical protein